MTDEDAWRAAHLRVCKRHAQELLAEVEGEHVTHFKAVLDWLMGRTPSVCVLPKKHADMWSRAGSFRVENNAIDLYEVGTRDTSELFGTLVHEVGHLCNRDAGDDDPGPVYVQLTGEEPVSPDDADRVWREEGLAWARGARLLADLGIAFDLMPSAERALGFYRERLARAGGLPPFDLPPSRGVLTAEQSRVLADFGWGPTR